MNGGGTDADCAELGSVPTWHRKNSESGNPRCRASFGIGVAVLLLRSDEVCQLGTERIRRATEAPNSEVVHFHAFRHLVRIKAI